MHISTPQLAAIGLAIGVIATGMSIGQTAQPVAPAAISRPAIPAKVAAEASNPIADPNAVVTLGNARFTVLTPELIRMEWAADGKFEDHASFVFLNRRLPVPNFEARSAVTGPRQHLTIKTSALTLDLYAG